MKIQIITSENQIQTNWSGGKTTQLYIFPENSIFENKDFIFRISSAVIETEISNFSPFNGYNRVLMALDNGVEIQHENQYSKQLNKFEIDSFSGDWKTSSKGKMTDFNLIFKEGVTGTLRYLSLNENSIMYFNNNSTNSFKGIYTLSETLCIQTETEIIHLQKGDLLLFSHFETNDKITFLEKFDAIEIDIQL